MVLLQRALLTQIHTSCHPNSDGPVTEQRDCIGRQLSAFLEGRCAQKRPIPVPNILERRTSFTLYFFI